VVGWVSGGTDAVAGVFVLSSLLLYLKSRERGSPLFLGASWLFFAGAALTKETALVFAALPAVCDLRGGIRPRDLLAGRHWGFLLVASAVFVIRSFVVENPSLTVSAMGFYRLAEQVCLSVRYILLPWPLPFFFAYPEGGIAGVLDLTIALAGLGMAALLFVRSPRARFGLVWIALALAPTLPLAFHTHGVFALRFLYLPLMGAAFLVADRSAPLPAKRRALVAAAGAIICVLFAGGTVTGLRDWRDEGVFFAKLEREMPGEVWSYEGLGRHYTRKRQLTEAADAYRRGIERVTAPEDRFSLAKRLGLQYAGLGRFRDALEAYKLMNHITPGAESLVGIGNCLWSLGENEGALAAFGAAIEADPANSLALANYAQLSADLDLEEQARASYERLLSLPAEQVDPRAATRARDFFDEQRGSTPNHAVDRK
jgi:tetratricopeptide (TPR) repeat protein